VSVAELHIADGLSLPLDVVTEPLGILAARRAGKSNAAVRIAEQMFLAQLHWVAIDPKGDWWGIRSSGDGRGPGLPIPILGGSHGDLPLSPDAGALIADIIVDHRLTCVLDVSGFASEAEKIKFLLAFGDRLFRRKDQSQEPTHVFFEEADDYVPQRAFPEQQRLVHVMARILKQGGSRGLGGTVISQRSAVVHKDILSQVQTLFALRTTGPQDRKAIRDWVSFTGENAEVVASLHELADGEAWVWSPNWLKVTKRVQFLRRETYDSGATPKVGQSRLPPATLADIDLAALRDQLTAATEPAGPKATRDQKRATAEQSKLIAEQQQQIADLERRLRERPARTVERVEVPVLAPADVDRLKEELDGLRSVAMRLIDVADGISSALVRARPAPAESPGNIREDIPPPTPTRQPAQHRSSRRSVVVTPTDLSNPQVRILEALASFMALGLDSVARSNVAVFADASPRSSGFANNLGALRTRGLIDYPAGGTVAITDDGLACVDEPRAIRSLAELHTAWERKLPRPQAAIMLALCDVYPSAMGRVELAGAVGQSSTSSGYANNLGALRSLGLIDYPRPGEVVATDLLFPSQLQR
jgi:uncharacterized protein